MHLYLSDFPHSFLHQYTFQCGTLLVTIQRVLLQNETRPASAVLLRTAAGHVRQHQVIGSATVCRAAKPRQRLMVADKEGATLHV